jgi:3-phenylpropionate/trans-cinnamate dioxygenase ferredoxin reductase subunit
MIAIVGAGVAGWSAAETLRELGYDGELCVFGSERTPPYERPALSKSFLTDAGLEGPPVLISDAPARREIHLEPGTTVLSIDRKYRTIETSSGKQFGYERLLIATGAQCRRLEIPGSELAGIHYLRGIEDARALRAELVPNRRIAVVGGGVIGLEVAASALARGCRVTVIEAALHVMGRVMPAELALAIEDLHRARGITIRTATRPVGFEAAGHRVAGVVVEEGEVIPADAVVVGIGVKARCELAATAELTTHNGILVDEHFKTSDEDIFAAGDVANVFHAGEKRRLRMEQWRPAQEQGRHAAASMLGICKPYRDVPSMWSDQHDFHIQGSGFGFEDAELIRRGDLQRREGLAYLGVHGSRLVAVCGVSIGTGIARTVRAARMVMQSGAPVDVDALGDPRQNFVRLARLLADAQRAEGVRAP